ncbi:MAG: electron transfer flavoprotein subunit beta/FixA family protein [Candidatus Kapabacteria bacterium]|nr:electron transfer flavoprotein subunit beta/FixA family protein [Candidatus Kapabacteria bacterium]
MNILVCISQVPDTTTKITVADNGNSINPQGVKFILNPYDEYTIEEGLQLREKLGGTVTAITVGNVSSQEILRTALAMGVDEAVHVLSDSKDAFSVANDIVDAAKALSIDLILFGRQSIDFDSFQMASTVAGLLEQPIVTMVSSLTISGTSVSTERDVEGGKEVVETSLPCVISVQKGINSPRYPKLPDIMKAKKRTIIERSSVNVASRVSTVSIELPSSKRAGIILGDSDADISELVRLLHEESKVI